MTNQDTLISPRIKALQEELAAGPDTALDTFWQEVNRSGAPLIEAVNDDETQVRVTFLWRATEAVEGVELLGGLTQRDPNLAQLLHLPDTDLWYRTFLARLDTRVVYMFLPKGSAAQLDPLNSKTYLYPPDEDNPERGGEDVSVLELPQAPPQPWVQPHPNISTGQLERHTLHSSVLNNERHIWVYTPPGYQASGNPYDLLILFDGWIYVQVMHAPVTLDNLIGLGKIPPLVAIMLDSPDRMQELLCYPPFADFLAQELMPWAHQNYHLTNKPTNTIVGGLSAGGLAAAYIGLRYPELFGKVLAQSPAFWWRPRNESEPEWLARQFAASPRLPLHFYLDVGLLEDRAEGHQGVSQLVSTRHLRNILQAKGYLVHYAEFSGHHDEICWQGTLADGLIRLLN